MACTMKTKIRLPISVNTIEDIRKEFQDISVEKDCVYAITRGLTLHNLLKVLSKENNEILIAEHSSSEDMYSTLYVERYQNGDSQTIETKSGEIIMYEITDPDEIEEILNSLKDD